MTPIVAEVLETAMALSPDERIDLATELLRSANTERAQGLEALRRDVQAGFDQIDRGEGIHVPHDELREYIRGLGREATERSARTLE